MATSPERVLLDTNIAATMLAHGITRIYTYDDQFQPNSRADAFDVLRKLMAYGIQSEESRAFRREAREWCVLGTQEGREEGKQ